MKSFSGYVGPFMPAMLAYIGDSKVFDTLTVEAALAFWHLYLIGIFKLLTIDFFGLKQPTTRRTSPKHPYSSHPVLEISYLKRLHGNWVEFSNKTILKNKPSKREWETIHDWESLSF
jgi:hypothetical protein